MSSDISVDELIRRAEEVSQEIVNTREAVKNLKEEKIRLADQLNKVRNERDNLLKEIRSLKKAIAEVREERKKLIEEYKSIVEARRSEILQLKAIRELLASKKAEIEGLSREVKIPISLIKQKIDEIEWKIQTSVLTPEQENELIKRLKAYTLLLNKAMTIREKKEEVLELRALYISTKSKVAELTERRDKLRGLIKAKTETINELKKRLNELIEKYKGVKSSLVELRKQLEEYNNELALKISRLNALHREYQEIQKMIERSKITRYLIEKKSQVSKEVESRKKKRLSLEELKIIYGNLEDLEES